jgi:hypothetical protein
MYDINKNLWNTECEVDRQMAKDCVQCLDFGNSSAEPLNRTDRHLTATGKVTVCLQLSLFTFYDVLIRPVSHFKVNNTTWRHKYYSQWKWTKVLRELTPFLRHLWEASNPSASQEVSCLLWNSKFHCHIYNSPSLVPIVRQINSVYISTHYLRFTSFFSSHILHYIKYVCSEYFVLFEETSKRKLKVSTSSINSFIHTFAQSPCWITIVEK